VVIMKKEEYDKGKQDAIMGRTASGTTENYVSGFFNGLKEINPLVQKFDENAFIDGYFNRTIKAYQQNSSYLAGRMIREMAANTSGLEKKVELPKAAPLKRRSDHELDSINEERWENDLPPTSRQELRERAAEYMEEKYGYDIDK